jgi:hypothetical protein
MSLLTGGRKSVEGMEYRRSLWKDPKITSKLLFTVSADVSRKGGDWGRIVADYVPSVNDG